MFKVISEKMGSTNWQEWDEGIKNRTDEAIGRDRNRQF